jgi:DNA polymerase I
MILRGIPFKDIQGYMRNILTNFKRLSLDDIGIPGGLGKSLNDYAVDDAQVRGCKYANEYLEARFLRGSKPKRVYIKYVKNKYPQTDVICFEYGKQVPPEFIVDYDIMINKTLKLPISRVIEPLGWNWNDFDPTATTLSAFGLD